MNRNLQSALFVTLCLPTLVACNRIQEPIGRTDGGVEDGGRPTSGGSGAAGSAGEGYAPTAGGRWGGSAGKAGSAVDAAGGAGGAGSEGFESGSAGSAARGGLPHGGYSGSWVVGGSAGSSGHAAVPQAGSPSHAQGGAGGWAGGAACNCDDGDLCTNDYCTPGGCVYQTRVTEEVDADDDGFFRGCDCDDADDAAYPGQTSYFAEPRVDSDAALSGPFDYNCDLFHEPQFTGVASACERLGDTEACFGQGWMTSLSSSECGQMGDYQVCEFKDDACTARTVRIAQRCR